MAERPILFSGAMVRSILDGQKSQTRRVVKPRKDRTIGCELAANELAGEVNSGDYTNSPYQPGDRLWVRETWQGPMWDGDWEDRPADAKSPKYCQYAADGGPIPEYLDAEDNLRQGWRPSIHMPRWACRLTLEITGVRVEKLNDCSEADSIAEGVTTNMAGDHHIDGTDARHATAVGDPAVNAFRSLWDSINGAGAWDANPWVWVVEFRRVAP